MEMDLFLIQILKISLMLCKFQPQREKLLQF